MREDWPFNVPRPGEGEVRACPTCGAELIFSCYHDGFTVQAKVMPAAEAERLRKESGEYRPTLMTCIDCGEEKEVRPGWVLAPYGATCEKCSA